MSSSSKASYKVGIVGVTERMNVEPPPTKPPCSRPCSVQKRHRTEATSKGTINVTPGVVVPPLVVPPRSPAKDQPNTPPPPLMTSNVKALFAFLKKPDPSNPLLLGFFGLALVCRCFGIHTLQGLHGDAIGWLHQLCRGKFY